MKQSFGDYCQKPLSPALKAKFYVSRGIVCVRTAFFENIYFYRFFWWISSEVFWIFGKKLRQVCRNYNLNVQKMILGNWPSERNFDFKRFWTLNKNFPILAKDCQSCIWRVPTRFFIELFFCRLCKFLKHFRIRANFPAEFIKKLPAGSSKLHFKGQKNFLQTFCFFKTSWFLYIIFGFWTQPFPHNGKKLLAGLSKLQFTYPEEVYEETVYFAKRFFETFWSTEKKKVGKLGKKFLAGLSKLHFQCQGKFFVGTNFSRNHGIFSRKPNFHQLLELIEIISGVSSIFKKIDEKSRHFCQNCFPIVRKRFLGEHFFHGIFFKPSKIEINFFANLHLTCPEENLRKLFFWKKNVFSGRFSDCG